MLINMNDPLSKETINFLKQASTNAYKDTDFLQNFLGDLTVELIQDEVTDGQLLIYSSENFIILAFRGTEKKKKDILIDLKCWPMKTPYGFVHFGFMSSFKNLWPKIKDKIDSKKKLIITGHSLGGALAQLCAVWSAAEHKVIPHFVVTFAQPRVGFFEFSRATSRYLSGRFFRISKLMDFVPRLPPNILFYVHPKDSGFKRKTDGNGSSHNYFDKFFGEICLIFVACLCYFLYLVIISHGITRH